MDNIDPQGWAMAGDLSGPWDAFASADSAYFGSNPTLLHHSHLRPEPASELVSASIDADLAILDIMHTVRNS